jgi:hypothetical protein
MDAQQMTGSQAKHKLLSGTLKLLQKAAVTANSDQQRKQQPAAAQPAATWSSIFMDVLYKIQRCRSEYDSEHDMDGLAAVMQA